jgi:hypothetical protein
MTITKNDTSNEKAKGNGKYNPFYAYKEKGYPVGSELQARMQQAGYSAHYIANQIAADVGVTKTRATQIIINCLLSEGGHVYNPRKSNKDACVEFYSWLSNHTNILQQYSQSEVSSFLSNELAKAQRLYEQSPADSSEYYRGYRDALHFVYLEIAAETGNDQ